MITEVTDVRRTADGGARGDENAMMRAWVIRRTGDPHEVLHLADVVSPKPGPGELLVDVEVAGVIYPDLLLVQGRYQIALPLPSTPGAEFVGRVVTAGADTATAVGTRVVGIAGGVHGAFAEQAVVVEAHVQPLPEELPAHDAVALPTNYVTAHLALHRRARVENGETVVVLGGAGGVGTAAIQLAKLAGAHVIGVDLGPDRAQLCVAVGADEGMDATDVDIAKAIRQSTGGRGADVVIDMVGDKLFDAVRRFIALEGRVVVVGFTGGAIPELRVNHLILRNYAVMGVNAMIALFHQPDVHKAAREAVVQALATGGIAPQIAAVYDLADLPDALIALEERRIAGKAVLDIKSGAAR
jgi:NADPH:quinone reductase